MYQKVIIVCTTTKDIKTWQTKTKPMLHHPTSAEHTLQNMKVCWTYLVHEGCIQQKFRKHLLPQLPASSIRHVMENQHLLLQEPSMFGHGAHGHLKLLLQVQALVNFGKHHESMKAGWLSLQLISCTRSAFWTSRPDVYGEICIITIGVVARLCILDPFCGAGEVLLFRAKVVEGHHGQSCSKEQHDLIGPKGADPSHGDRQHPQDTHGSSSACTK